MASGEVGSFPSLQASVHRKLKAGPHLTTKSAAKKDSRVCEAENGNRLVGTRD